MTLASGHTFDGIFFHMFSNSIVVFGVAYPHFVIFSFFKYLIGLQINIRTVENIPLNKIPAMNKALFQRSLC